MTDDEVDGIFVDVGGKRPNLDYLFDGPTLEHLKVASVSDHLLSCLSTDVNVELHLQVS